ncbi:hypothetical protein [Zavarzinia sp.]|uniref:hypothetical protein n=1 Tax=Zavarzinia sp. TaxID=2027920 RepID=UPI003568F63E
MDRLVAAEARLLAALDQLEALAAPAADAVDPEVHATLVAEYDRLTGDVEQLAQALEEARADNRRLDERLGELAAENAALREAPAATESPAPVDVDLEHRLADAEAFAEEALNELEAARAEIDRLKAALTAAEQQGAQRQAELFRLEAATDTAAKRLDQTVARLDRAIAE